jgi:tetratricopeptide (TPR) repeat protein
VVAVVVLNGLLAGSAAAAGAELEPVPEPGAGVVEASVRRDLAAAHAAVTALAARAAGAGERAAAYGELGRLYAAYELWDAARPCFANALALERDSAAVARWHHYLGYVLERRGDLEAAVRHYERAVAGDPGDHAALLRGADLDLSLGRAGEAETAFRRLADEEGFAAAARFGLGRVALARGDPDAAITALRRTLELQPEAGQVHYALAQAYRRAGRIDEARRHLERRSEARVRFPDPLVDSLATAPRGGAFHKLRGDEAVLAGRLGDAAAAYRRAVEAEPGSFHYRKSLGLTLYQLGRPDEAARELEAALDLEPDLPPALVPAERARIRYALGGIAANRRRGERALEHFRAAVRLDPGYAEAHLQVGNLLGAAGRLEEALAAFDRAVAADPDLAEARLQRATTLMDLGRFAEAVPDLERRLELEPNDEQARWLLQTARRESGGGTR